MEKERKRMEAGRGGAAPWKKVSSFMRRSRRVFLRAYGELDDKRYGVMLLRALRCLRR